MATYTKQLLSGSTNGKGILVVTAGSPGTLLHTAVAGTSNLDEVWLYALNETAADIETTFEFGGTTAGSDTITVNIPFKTGLQLVVPGLLLQNSLVVRAYGAVASGIIIQGFVNRITA